jgi:hypothetical protein
VAAAQGARAWLGSSWLEEARCLFPSGAAHRARARDCLARARALYEECDAQPDMALTEMLLQAVILEG